MNTASSRPSRHSLPCCALLVAFLLAALLPPASAQLFTNLQAFGSRLKAGDPAVTATNSPDGPKGITTADFDGDNRPDLAVANTDGTVTIWFGRPQGRFSAPSHLQTGFQELRGIVAGDFLGDSLPDLATAAPYGGRVMIFQNLGGTFSAPVELTSWQGARNLAAGDFDGDGQMDLALAGTTNGLRHLRNSGNGAFETMTNLTSLAGDNNEFPKPLYVLGVFRPAGEARDELIATHADSSVLWLLGAGPDGALAVNGQITNQYVHSLAVGPITQAAASGQQDLVTASREFGTIQIHRGNYGSDRFEHTINQRIQVPGAPRAVSLADLDGDGWNEVVVVLRNFDRVITYKNSNGVLRASSEMQVGKSPRELVTSDFNEDGRPDVAVMNRGSMDVSVLFTHAGQAGFSGLDLVYPVDGSVSGLSVFDFNRDGRDDVVQLHRASAEFSVRLARTNGLLAAPMFFSVGRLPSAQSAVDVNNDGISDMVTANLGGSGVEAGSVSVRLGMGTGSFGPETRYLLPATDRGGLFALVAGDFDNDGNIDLAAGFYDCRIGFYRGDGSGGFTLTRQEGFTYEARVMVTGDFDQDGDTDIAGAGYAGNVVVLENTGDFHGSGPLMRADYPPPGNNKYGTRDIVSGDVNNDGDQDLIVGSGDGAMLFFGGQGMQFHRVTDSLPGTDFPNSGITMGDLDGDTHPEIAVACRLLACVTILKRTTNDLFEPALSVDVPSGDYLATGDLDGDGHADLVGTGSALWTALSSRRAQSAPPAMPQTDRPTAAVPVINELLALNTGLPLDADGDRYSDWLELYNAGDSAILLHGWKLRYSETGGATTEYPFPPTAFFGPDTHLVIVFSETKRSLYHTGFRLSGTGGEVALVNPSGETVDAVRYAAQQENVSYARYRDGLATFTFNPYPSPGRPNSDNGPVEPIARLENFSPLPARSGEPIRFVVTGRDDVGILGVSIVWQRRDTGDTNFHRTQLFDDGMHDDGDMLDGLFAGLLEPGLPEGAEIQFYLEVTDFSEQVLTVPDEPVFASPGQPVSLYSLAVGGLRPALEISELVAANTNGLRDELGQAADWVEIRNTSTQPVPLGGVALSRDYFGGNRFTFAGTNVLNPGEHLVVYCGDTPTNGPLHAPFSLDRGGDALLLTALSGNGTRLVVDSIAFGPQPFDTALARLGSAGAWRIQAPTPRAPNVPGTWLGLVSSNAAEFTLVFPTTTNATYVVEHAGSLNAPAWTALPPVSGDGLEKLVTQPLTQERFYRVRREP